MYVLYNIINAKKWYCRDCPEAKFMNIKFRWDGLGIFLRVLRFEVPIYNVCIKNRFQITFAQGGVKSVSLEVTVNSIEDNS